MWTQPEGRKKIMNNRKELTGPRGCVSRLVRLVRRQLWRALLCRPEEVAELSWITDMDRLKRFEETYGATLCRECHGRQYHRLFPRERCPWCDDGTNPLPNVRCAPTGAIERKLK